jgi:3-dehydroquinate synthase
MEDLPMSESFKVKSSIRDYEVYFTESIGPEIKNILKAGDYIIIDNVVSKLNGIREYIQGHENVIRIEASENTKSYEGIIPFFEQLIVSGFKRNNRLIAIGGGITQDVTAFIASILYRGVDWIFFPTTLLAQADSCIGSKTSINFGKYKNQLGNFYPPLSIHIDTKILGFLQERDIKSGVGEMAHYFFVSGPSDVDFFEMQYLTTLQDQSNMQTVVGASLAIKKRYIEIDEFDRNERIVFNYGHTFGHAIESITNYSIPHGVGVSFGMDMANYISMKKGYISISEFTRAHQVFKTIWSGYAIKNISIQELLKAMEKDKKNENGKLGLILTKGWGKMFKDLTSADDEFVAWLNEYMKEYQF